LPCHKSRPLAPALDRALGPDHPRPAPRGGAWTAYGVASPVQSHFGGPLASFPGTDTKVYIAALAFGLNVLVTVVLTLVLRAAKVDPGADQTRWDDYAADLEDEGVAAELDPHAPAHT
jgi:SSS family solute:Na+ symporter